MPQNPNYKYRFGSNIAPWALWVQVSACRYACMYTRIFHKSLFVKQMQVCVYTNFPVGPDFKLPRQTGSWRGVSKVMKHAPKKYGRWRAEENMKLTDGVILIIWTISTLAGGHRLVYATKKRISKCILRSFFRYGAITWQHPSYLPRCRLLESAAAGFWKVRPRVLNKQILGNGLQLEIWNREPRSST